MIKLRGFRRLKDVLKLAQTLLLRVNKHKWQGCPPGSIMVVKIDGQPCDYAEVEEWTANVLIARVENPHWYESTDFSVMDKYLDNETELPECKELGKP